LDKRGLFVDGTKSVFENESIAGQSQGPNRTLTAQQPRRERSRKACAALLLIETLRDPDANVQASGELAITLVSIALTVPYCPRDTIFTLYTYTTCPTRPGKPGALNWVLF
jgi:hypothetical protein